MHFISQNSMITVLQCFLLVHIGAVDHLDIKFTGSFPKVSAAPPPNLPEFAFIGRSNVGKSSLINMVAGRKALAKTSSTPGKTQLINFFEVEDKWNLVDLPGYGYAKLSKKHRASLLTMIRTYLGNRESLYCAMVLMDAKVPLQAIDHEMIRWLAERGIPQAWVFTKVDKGRSNETSKILQKTLKTLSAEWEEPPPYFRTSSTKVEGREDLLAFINKSIPA